MTSVTSDALTPDRSQSAKSGHLAILPKLTGFRACAALLVALSHFTLPVTTGTTLSRIFNRGGFSGVTAFFILSGVVLTWSELSKGRERVPSLRSYFIQRGSRVYPLHLAVLFILICFGVKIISIPVLISHITLTQAWLVDHHATFSLNAVAWTLSVEIFLYLCFPFLFAYAIRMYKKWGAKAIAAIISIGFTIPIIALAFTLLFNRTDVFYKDNFSAFYFLVRFPLTRMGDFILGIGIALAIYYARPIKNSVALILQIGAASVYVFLASMDYSLYSMQRFLSYDLMYMPIFATAIFALGVKTTRPSKHPFESKILMALGVWSFAFYLIHYKVWKFTMNHGGSDLVDNRLSCTLYVAGLFLGITLLSKMAHEYIEQPSQKKIRKTFIRNQTK